MAGLAELIILSKKGGWEMAVLDMSIDTTTAMGRLILDFQVRMFQFEREQTSERTSTALRHMQRNGRAAGGNPPFGWRLGERYALPSGAMSTRIEPDPTEQATLARIIALVNGGMNPNAVANRLNAEKIPARNGSPWQACKIARIMERHESGRMVALPASTGA
jgi:DNA invertase Pin-like site-specific DNA recombinase